jgi:endonuclease G
VGAEASRDGRRISVTIPVRITVDIGDAERDGDTVRSSTVVTAAPAAAATRPVAAAADDDEVVLTEARPEDYADREGYKPGFLGHGIDVPLPEVKRNPADVLTFEFGGKTRSVLDYQHYSVVMNRRRKMCVFSAVNINGNEPRKAKRPGWRSDPRIPEDAQTIRGPYGNPPKFARGHMTRREDPMWGTPETGARGNADSMHLTNAVPQMQPFNAGIWLGLEDYALQNAREDDMRICVFTGPVFRDDDPARFGVKIPITFWKVIAFVHDQTGALSATGYTMSQKKFLQEEEFVFGAHSTAQTSLAAIEDLAGVSFGALTGKDPLAGGIEESAPSDLAAFQQIRFV